MYQKLLLFILLIVELTKITFCRLKFLLLLSWCGAKLFKALQTVCLCFKLGSLYFIKTSISFSLLKKVEKKSSQIFSFFGPKYQNHRHSPQFLDLLKSSWKFSSVLNFHKGQLHCTQYYFFKYCSFKFETVSSRLLPLHICSTKK